jgi:hypothetical protein
MTLLETLETGLLRDTVFNALRLRHLLRLSS